MKINQYCSVCKKHLDMEVVPTDDGGDDGVIWLQCPDCRGFLPKFTGEAKPAPRAETGAPPAAEPAAPAPEPAAEVTPPPAEIETVDEDVAAAEPDEDAEPEVAAEPVSEYAAQLAAADPATARPYRPTDSYDVGDVLHHLAWDDIGVVVAREVLPGGRQVVKAYFESVGVVRLIEQAAGGS